MTIPALIFALIALVSLAVVALRLFQTNRRLKRAEYVRSYAWPPGLLDKLEGRHAGFTRKETALVAQGLRQFFLAYLQSGNQYVAMPSQVADDLWHEFILYTRAYQDFCENAFGSFLHHTPAVALASGRTRDNAGLRRVWWFSCKDESIDPGYPSRLPLLFALDVKLNIPGGGIATCRTAISFGATVRPERNAAVISPAAPSMAELKVSGMAEAATEGVTAAAAEAAAAAIKSKL